MLLEFSIENYKMFADKATISMVEEGRVSTDLREHSTFMFTRVSTIFEKDEESNESKSKRQSTINRVNPIGLIYGANGSGKTSLLLSLSEVLALVGITQMYYGPFMQLAKESSIISQVHDKNKPVTCSFEVINQDTLDYFSYSVQISEINGQIYFGDEKLITGKFSESTNGVYKLYDSRFREIYNRHGSLITTDFKELQKYFDAIQIQNTGKVSSVINKLRDINTDIFPEFDDSDAEQKFNSFLEIFERLYTASKFDPHNTPNTIYLENTFADNEIQRIINKIEKQDSFKKALLKAFETIDVGIFDIEIEHQEEGNEIYFIHGIGENKIKVPFIEESDGTRKFIYQFLSLYNATENKGVYLIDELENNYHPAIQRFIIDLFIENGGQLISTTHNTEIMNFNELPVESIMFIDKSPIDNKAETYQLIDFEGELNRSKYNFRKMYEQGRLGAFPRLMEGVTW